jgi:hypothetical protein
VLKIQEKLAQLDRSCARHIGSLGISVEIFDCVKSIMRCAGLFDFHACCHAFAQYFWNSNPAKAPCFANG